MVQVRCVVKFQPPIGVFRPAGRQKPDGGRSTLDDRADDPLMFEENHQTSRGIAECQLLLWRTGSGPVWEKFGERESKLDRLTGREEPTEVKRVQEPSGWTNLLGVDGNTLEGPCR